MDDITILSVEEITGDNKLSIFDKYGTSAAITDFAILLGGTVSNDNYTNEGNDLKDRVGTYFTKTAFENKVLFFSNHDTYIYFSSSTDEREHGVRPVMSYSSIFNQYLNEKENEFKIKEVEFGEYPQMVENRFVSNILENLYNNKKLKETGKIYTTNDSSLNNEETLFQAKEHIEYEYRGQKYIRVVADKDLTDVLSDGRVVEEGKAYWIKVEPIVWMIDEERDLSVCKKILLAGIPFSDKKEYTGDFENTKLKWFLKNIFLRDIRFLKIKNNSVNNNEDSKVSELKKIIMDISESAKELENRDIVVKQVNQLVQEYNNNVKELSNKNNELSFGSLDSLKRNLEINLKIILDRVNQYKQENNKYIDMIGYINEAIICINEGSINDNYQNSEFMNDLKVLNSVCLPFLSSDDSNEIKNEIVKLFENERDNIQNYLNSYLDGEENKELKPKYNTREELIMSLRRKINPVLIKLNKKVIERDMLFDVKEGFKNIMLGVYEESKNKMITFYLSEINKAFSKIVILSKRMQTEKGVNYCNKAKELININVEYSKNSEEIKEELMSILLSLYNISYDMEEEIKEFYKIESSYIDVSL